MPGYGGDHSRRCAGEPLSAHAGRPGEEGLEDDSAVVVTTAPALATTTLGGDAGLFGFVLFLAILAVADWSLRRWGSAAIRRRPRPGGRVTLLFLGLVVVCAGLELAAAKLWPLAPAASVVVLVVQLPAAIAVVLGLDRIMPDADQAA